MELDERHVVLGLGSPGSRSEVKAYITVGRAVLVPFGAKLDMFDTGPRGVQAESSPVRYFGNKIYI